MTEPDLARRVDAAQSILETPTAERARLFERAFAECSRAIVTAMARLDPAGGASAVDVAGGLAIFAGHGSPLTQALGVGLNGPVTAADLDRIEAHLLPTGTGTRQLELCPYVDPELPALLTDRGYRIHEWQLAWECEVPQVPIAPARAPDASLVVRPIRPGEEDVFFRTVMAGFLETDDVPEDAMALLRPSAFAERHELFLALLNDEPIGGGTLAWNDGIAFVNGSGVRPGFRNHGAQGALLRARLTRARALGCTTAYSTTLPGTSSRRNMERVGFRVAYPKILMLRPG